MNQTRQDFLQAAHYGDDMGKIMPEAQHDETTRPLYFRRREVDQAISEVMTGSAVALPGDVAGLRDLLLNEALRKARMAMQECHHGVDVAWGNYDAVVHERSQRDG